MEGEAKIEDFYGVYLLCSQSEEKKYRGKVYIGYTVNPNRRIKQHNRGVAFGGARKTNNKGPWKMVMIIHGFPNNISALQFEWAWQSPKDSSRIKNIVDLWKKKKNESYFEYNFRILAEMLRTGPWNRLPLTIRWLSPDYYKEFPPDKLPPMHMLICHGLVSIKKKSKPPEEETNFTQTKRDPRLMNCHLCMHSVESQESKVTCINPKCKLTSHVICLANVCLERGQYVPIEGDCPICETHFLWGDIIRKKNGCNDLVEGEGDFMYLSDSSLSGDCHDEESDDGT